jgi:hypothetical protein
LIGALTATGAKSPAGAVIGGLLIGTFIGYFLIGLCFRWFRNPRDVVRQAGRD